MTDDDDDDDDDDDTYITQDVRRFDSKICLHQETVIVIVIVSN